MVGGLTLEEMVERELEFLAGVWAGSGALRVGGGGAVAEVVEVSDGVLGRLQSMFGGEVLGVTWVLAGPSKELEVFLTTILPRVHTSIMAQRGREVMLDVTAA